MPPMSVARAHTSAESAPFGCYGRVLRSDVRRAPQLFFGTLLGLALAEGMFWYADGGAFAHLNLYVADPVLGVRLAPGGTERVRLGGGAVTSVRINAEGYRGADWGPARADEIVILGDSQVFGLGVEEHQTFSAVVAARLGRPVRDAGVPTYGPPEYLAVLDELLAARAPKEVVLVVNFANDVFELDTPNRDRHGVLDGWAVRREMAAGARAFPGRGWLFSNSHLVLAIRRAWWTEGWGQGVGASADGWARLVDAAATGGATGIDGKRFEDGLVAMRDRCEAAGAQLLVVALPLDVQVSADEWAKYAPAAPIDMAPTRALLHDLVRTATYAGIPALDATAALVAAEPGAFLAGDLHLTPKGHAALAGALAERLLPDWTAVEPGDW